MVSTTAFLLFCTLFQLLIAADPRHCVFPFIYRGKSYYTCTEVDSQNHPWCATTANYDKSPQWKYCAKTEYGGNSGGKPCVFPFLYMSHVYYTCAGRPDHKGPFWCSTTGSYDKDKKWSYCADNRLDANYPTSPCIFPFIFENKLYSTCTIDGRSDGRLWCSISSNFDIEPIWAYCEPSHNFLFIYKNKSYYSCTTEGDLYNQLWCATTPNYDKDSRWKSCSFQEYGGNSNGQPCVFPFNYKEEAVTTCIDEDEKNETNGRFWCATTENFDVDMKWTFCADTRLNKKKENGQDQ
ncbi:epididymal sperm-binding protein 1-like [Thamnophis elegans]|uniref:epididymal sperm-binding protein 1-like n=1 Tax=Thamnophis elegans TaxID=35005 RepID=UPI0013784109|nr:epididymal sperm-binding protein 1-like [Thamnophis elegans]